MILIDTSIWIDHFRRANAALARYLESGAVAVHPFVIGEIALGSLKNRRAIIESLQDLPALTAATDEEVLEFIEAQSLAASGVGYLDAHLLASVQLTPSARLWTRDRKLKAAAEALGLAADEA